jgi:hypothetical protein
MTLDTVLSLIGGQLSLFMWVLGLCLMYYHHFHMENAMIKEIYNKYDKVEDE